MDIITEYRISKQIVNDDFPEMFTEEQKIVLRRLVDIELKKVNLTFDKVYNALDIVLHDEEYDLTKEQLLKFRKQYNIMRIIKPFNYK